MMTKLLFAMLLCAALVACKQDEAAPADAAATDTAAAPAQAPAPAAAAVALPAACEAYFKRAEACFTKAGGGGEAMKSAFGQSRAQLAQVPADQMEMGCKAANDAFAQTAAALKCE
jgi:hypothetical protein